MSALATVSRSAAALSSERVYCFAVFAEPTPCALPRVLEVFAAHGFVPMRCLAHISGRDDSQLAIEVQMAGLDPDQAARIARRLGRVVTVTEVLWSKKHCLDAA